MMRVKSNLAVFTLSLLAFTSCLSKKDSILSASFTIETSPPTHQLKPSLFGSNIQWEQRGDGILDSNNNFSETALDLASNLKLSHLRFPGGSLSNTYRWKDAIGQLDSRLPGLNFSREPVASYFGTDEFIKLIGQLKLAPVITLNSSMSADYAVEWLRYMEQRSDANLAQSYWEIGNEIYSPEEVGYVKASDYAKKASEFASALKQANTNVHVGAALEISFTQAAWMANVFPHLVTWNTDVIPGLSEDIDFVSLHFYAPYDKYFSDDRLTDLTLAGPVVFKENLAILEQQLQQSERYDIQFAITEYNTFFGDTRVLDPRTAGPEAALFSALMLFEMARNPRVILANHWSLLNNAVFGLFGKDKQANWSVRPSFDVMTILSAQATNHVLPATIDSPHYSVEAKGNIPKIDKVPMIDALATRDSDGVGYYNIVNRSPYTAIELQLRDNNSITSLMEMKQWRYGNWQQGGQSTRLSARVGGATIRLPPLSFTLVTNQSAIAKKEEMKGKRHVAK